MYPIFEQIKPYKKPIISRIMVVLMILSISLLFEGCNSPGTSKNDGMGEGIEVVSGESTTSATTVDEEENASNLGPVQELTYDFNDYEAVAMLEVDKVFPSEPIKGLYVSGNAAGISSWMDRLLDIADTTEINAFVIDIKNDSGVICYDMDLPAVQEIGAGTRTISDIDGLMDRLYQHDVYPIARIVTFKDPFLAQAKPEYAIKNKDGSLWTYKEIHWLNPYNKDAWKYVVDVAKEAAKLGFKEIQFDYIRFEATSLLKDADFGGLDANVSKEEIILEFIEYAMKELEPYDVKVSADVFGTVISSDVDAAIIGQDYLAMSKKLDVICPMIYPSHYGYGFYGTPKGKHSDLYPYEIIKGSMDESSEVLSVIPEKDHVAIVRPWLQAFTASYLGRGNYMTYDKAAIRTQIDATYDAGLKEWILWNSGVKYNKEVFLPNEAIE